jgi:hypothetical protein
MIVITTLLFAFSFSLHPMHVAYTSIEVNPEQKTIAVVHKFFTADVSLLFYHLFEKSIEPQKDFEFSKAEIDLINNYMKERFILVSDNDTIDLNYLRKEQEDESIWLYYSGKFTKAKPKSLIINNLLMLDLYFDQTNLVIATHGMKENGFTFNFNNRQSVLALQ